jgi:hypothetical protein
MNRFTDPEQSVSKTCNTSLEQLTESHAAFIMYSMVPVTSNMSNSICLQSVHNFTENMCYCCMIHCKHLSEYTLKNISNFRIIYFEKRFVSGHKWTDLS